MKQSGLQKLLVGFKTVAANSFGLMICICLIVDKTKNDIDTTLTQKLAKTIPNYLEDGTINFLGFNIA